MRRELKLAALTCVYLALVVWEAAHGRPPL